MKKERAAFFCNIAAVVLVTAVLVSAAPRISAVGAVGQRFTGNSKQDPRFVLSSGHRGTP